MHMCVKSYTTYIRQCVGYIYARIHIFVYIYTQVQVTRMFNGMTIQFITRQWMSLRINTQHCTTLRYISHHNNPHYLTPTSTHLHTLDYWPMFDFIATFVIPRQCASVAIFCAWLKRQSMGLYDAIINAMSWHVATEIISISLSRRLSSGLLLLSFLISFVFVHC